MPLHIFFYQMYAKRIYGGCVPPYPYCHLVPYIMRKYKQQLRSFIMELLFKKIFCILLRVRTSPSCSQMLQNAMLYYFRMLLCWNVGRYSSRKSPSEICIRTIWINNGGCGLNEFLFFLISRR